MRIKGWAGLAVVTLVGAMASTAFAQPGGGGRGGRGGFGGGMFGQMSSIQLAANAAVQKDLGVTDDQTAKLKTINDDFMAEIRPAGGGGGGGGGRGTPPTDEERAARAAKRTEAIAKFKPKVAEVLSATQMERLGQIELQAMRSGVYSDATVVKTLNLTKEQQDKIASIGKEFQEKQREMFRGAAGAGGGGGGSEEARAKIRETMAAHDKDLAAVLTADQQKQLTAMKGKEFDLSQLMGGFGGGGRGGNRPQN